MAGGLATEGLPPQEIAASLVHLPGGDPFLDQPGELLGDGALRLLQGDGRRADVDHQAPRVEPGAGQGLDLDRVGQPLALAHPLREAPGEPRARSQDHAQELQGVAVGVGPRHGQAAGIEVGLVAGRQVDLPVALGEALGRRDRRAGRRRPLGTGEGEEPLGALGHLRLVERPGDRDADAGGQRAAVAGQAFGPAEGGEALGRALERPAPGVRSVELLEEGPGGPDVGLIGQALELGRRLAGHPAAPILGEGGLAQELGGPLEGRLPVGRAGVDRHAQDLERGRARHRGPQRLGLVRDPPPVAPAGALRERAAGDQRLARELLAPGTGGYPGAHGHDPRPLDPPHPEAEAAGLEDGRPVEGGPGLGHGSPPPPEPSPPGSDQPSTPASRGRR